MSKAAKVYDIAFIGHYTKDTIVSPSGVRIVDGGAVNYGAHVAARMELATAVVTRLAREDFHVVDDLMALKVDVFAHPTPQSTCLRLVYPTTNADERTIYVTSTAGAFTPAEFKGLRARAFVLGASMRGEIGLDVIEELAQRNALLAIDVQGFVRVARDGKLTYESWPEKSAVLMHVDVLKTDTVEAEMLTDTANTRDAARMLADLGPREIVLTHHKGVLVYAYGQLYEASFHHRKLVGRSGRGDTCIAAYIARRLAAPPAEAIIWAAAVTSLKMEAEGPFRRERQQVDDLIAQAY
jgi:sugar/nucleoside kinase (ribokinase family)